ncbi:phage holin family protein [Bradyrhizobium sp. PUT101]|uniref:phage holin family protein n=1 Tax=Bradyrhizobium sp. PUT101 TaxID=3447427 RepID=UPI003F853530
MTIETLMREEIMEGGLEGEAPRTIQWSSVFAGALAAGAMSFILLSFGVAIGLGVSSASPTWRDTSAALALLSGLYLIIQAVISFGFGGYIAGRTTRPAPALATIEDDSERRDGLHGLTSWALAVLFGAALLALLGASAVDRSPMRSSASNTSAAEPLLSYELDKLFRAPRRPPNTDLREPRAEAGRILMTSSSHSGITSDDRTYLVQQVAALTGLAAPDSEKRVDALIAESRTAINRARRNSIIVAFSVAAATLIGAVVAWAAAAAGGRHRDGAPLPNWMASSNRFHRNPRAMPVP